MKLTAALFASTALALMLTPAANALDIGVDLGADVSVDLGVVGVGLSADGAASATSTSTSTSSGGAQAGASASKKVVVGATAGDDETSTNGSIEIGEVIALIANSDWSETSLNGASTTDAELIAAGEIMADARTDFDAVVEAEADEIAELHTALAANAGLSAWLEAEHVSTQSVVAVGLKADGSLAVITSGD